jgi:hypothetical protein
MQHSTTRAPSAQPIIFSVIRDGEGLRIYIANPGQSGKVSKAHYIDALAAAEHAYWLTQHTQNDLNKPAILSLPDHLRDQLIAHFQIEGELCYHGKSTRYVEPWNDWMWQGWEAARRESVGILAWGWPMPADSSKVVSTRAWSGSPQLATA